MEALRMSTRDGGGGGPNILLGDGGGGYRAGLIPQDALVGRRPSVADLNRDGDPDIVEVDHSSNRLNLTFNASRHPSRPALEGVPLCPSPSFGDGSGGAVVLSPSPRVHVIDTTAGTIDGVRSTGFKGHAFHLESFDLEPMKRAPGAGRVASGHSGARRCADRWRPSLRRS